MAITEKDLVYSRLPVPTWRWLGVNEVRVHAELMADSPAQKLVTIPSGEERELVIVYREEGAAALQVEVGANATLHLTQVRLAKENARYVHGIKARLAENARLVCTLVETGGASAVSALEVDLSGDGGTVDVAALCFADGEQTLDMNYIIRQQAKNTKAELSVHGALAGRARKIFRGTLDFARGATGSVGREREDVTVLSPDVVNRSAPLMLSGEAEVDGRHAASIGKIDEAKLFYLMSRGLSAPEAKRLVTLAAVQPVLDRVKDEALADEVRSYIEGRLSDD